MHGVVQRHIRQLLAHRGQQRVHLRKQQSLVSPKPGQAPTKALMLLRRRAPQSDSHCFPWQRRAGRAWHWRSAFS